MSSYSSLDKSIPKDLVMSLQRTMCPSACPDYSLSIYADGRVLYEGRRYVAIKGKQKIHISKGQVNQLYDEFCRINFFTLKDKYEALIKDGSITKISLRADGLFKEVINCHPSQAPAGLYSLEKMIDETTGSKRWITRFGQPVLEP